MSEANVANFSMVYDVAGAVHKAATQAKPRESSICAVKSGTIYKVIGWRPDAADKIRMSRSHQMTERVIV